MGLTIDGTKGGFLIGQPHSNDGIPVLTKFSDGYRLTSEFEGQEYLLNPGATQEFRNHLDSINQFDLDKLTISKPKEDITNVTILNCKTDSPHFKSKMLLLDARGSQYVINRYSTWKNYKKLEEMNNAVGWRFKGKLFDFEP